MSDNPVAEIIARAIKDWMVTGSYGANEFEDTTAHVIIAALEKAGWKMLAREPTKEMTIAGETAVRDAIDGDMDSRRGVWETYIQPDVWAAVGYQAMFDAAPSWGGNEQEGLPEPAIKPELPSFREMRGIFRDTSPKSKAPPPE